VASLSENIGKNSKEAVLAWRTFLQTKSKKEVFGLSLMVLILPVAVAAATYQVFWRSRASYPITPPITPPVTPPPQEGNLAIKFTQEGEGLIYDGAAFSQSVFTLEAWVKWDGGQTEQHIIRKKEQKESLYNDSFSIFIGRSPETLNARVMTGNGVMVIATDNVLRDRLWHHLALVVSPDNYPETSKFYVDGQLKGSFRHTTPLVYGNGELYFALHQGARSANNTSFRGAIDETRFSNISRYSNNFIPERVFSADKNTIALWHFDNDTSYIGQGEIIGQPEFVSPQGPASLSPKPPAPVYECTRAPNDCAWSLRGCQAPCSPGWSCTNDREINGCLGFPEQTLYRCCREVTPDQPAPTVTPSQPTATPTNRQTNNYRCEPENSNYCFWSFAGCNSGISAQDRAEGWFCSDDPSINLCNYDRRPDGGKLWKRCVAK